MIDKETVLKTIKELMPKVVDIEIISNKYVKCYEAEDLFGKRNEYYTSDLKYWLGKLKEQNE